MSQEITIGGTFSGIGGLELGIERAIRAAGHRPRTVWQCEAAEYPRRVLAKHWPNATQYEDIRTMEAAPYVDIMCGGFPCQDISIAGRGAGLAGSRSGLFFELMRLVGVVRPAVIVLENVAAALTRGGVAIAGALTEAGYDAAWSIVSAADVGAPHLRRRWFCVAWRPPLADAQGQRRAGLPERAVTQVAGTGRGGQHVADPDRVAVQQQLQPGPGGAPAEPVRDGQERAMAYASRRRCGSGNRGRDPEPGRGALTAGCRGGEVADSNQRGCEGAARPGRPGEGGQGLAVDGGGRSDRRPGSTKSGVGGGVDGLLGGVVRGVTRYPAPPGAAPFAWEPPRTVAARSVPKRPARIKGLGNAVVPDVAELVARWGVLDALRLTGVL